MKKNSKKYLILFITREKNNNYLSQILTLYYTIKNSNIIEKTHCIFTSNYENHKNINYDLKKLNLNISYEIILEDSTLKCLNKIAGNNEYYNFEYLIRCESHIIFNKHSWNNIFSKLDDIYLKEINTLATICLSTDTSSWHIFCSTFFDQNFLKNQIYQRVKEINISNNFELSKIKKYIESSIDWDEEAYWNFINSDSKIRKDLHPIKYDYGLELIINNKIIENIEKFWELNSESKVYNINDNIYFSYNFYILKYDLFKKIFNNSQYINLKTEETILSNYLCEKISKIIIGNSFAISSSSLAFLDSKSLIDHIDKDLIFNKNKEINIKYYNFFTNILIKDKLLDFNYRYILSKKFTLKFEKIIEYFKYKYSIIKLILNFFELSSYIWITIGLFAAILFATSEFILTVIIQLFLYTIGLINSSGFKLPKIYGFEVPLLTFNYTLLLLLCISCARSIFQFISTYSSIYITEFASYKLKKIIIYDIIFKLTNKESNSSEHNFKIGEIFPKCSAFFSNLSSILIIIIQLISVMVAILYLSWKESIATFVGIYLIGLLVIKINKLSQKYSHKMIYNQQNYVKKINEISKNFLFIRLMKNTNNEINNTKNLVYSYRKQALYGNFFSTFGGVLPPFLGITLLILIIFLSHKVLGTNSSILIALIYLVIKMVQNLSNLSIQFGYLILVFPHVMLGLKYFYRVKNRIEEKKDFIYSQLNNERFPSIKFKGIIAKNLYYSYSDEINPIIQNLSFQINSNEIFTIIGPSGTGKSTILMLLLGIYKPSDGIIYYNNIIQPEEYFSKYNSKIGYVGPEPFLISGSIRDNLFFGINGEISDHEIWKALKIACLDDFIMQLNEKLDYKIQEDHSGLSAGQKQRLCLARAILNNPDILFLDEATSNLDIALDEKISKNLHELKSKTTIIIITHREAILKYADSILCIEQNK